MTYFNRKKLLAQNPPQTKNIDLDILNEVISCSQPLHISACLKKCQSVLTEDPDFFESVVDAYLYQGHYFVSSDGELLGHVLLKQLVRFIRQSPVDIVRLTDAFSIFAEKINITDTTNLSLDSLMALYDFRFEGQAVFSKQTTIEILYERLLTLIEKKAFIESNNIPYPEQNVSQTRVPSYLQSCLLLLLECFGEAGFARIRPLYDANQADVAYAMLNFCRYTVKQEKHGILEKLRQINQQRIADNRENTAHKTDYIELRDLLLWAKPSPSHDPSDPVEHAIQQSVSYKASLIGMDILADVLTRPQLLSETIPKQATNPQSLILENYFSLIYYQFSQEEHPEAYRRLSQLLQAFAKNENLHIKYRIEAMLVAYDCLDLRVDNHRTLIAEMVNLPEEHHWGSDYIHRACRIDDSELFYRPLFRLADVLACLNIRQFGHEARKCLYQFREKHSQNQTSVNQIYDAVMPIYLSLLAENKVIFENGDYRNDYIIRDFNAILVAHPLSISQQQPIIQALQSTKEIMVANDFYAVDEISSLLLDWQNKINQTEPDSIDLIDESDSNLKPWDRATLHWQKHIAPTTDWVADLVDCQLVTEAVSKTVRKKLQTDESLENIIMHALFDSDNLQDMLSERADGFWETYGNYNELFSYLASFVGVTVQPLGSQYAGIKGQIDINQSICLNPCPTVTCIQPDDVYYFSYADQVYQFNAYESVWFDGVNAFASALVNVFLGSINHSKRLYQVAYDNYDEIFFITRAEFVPFETVNQRLQLPIKAPTWAEYGYTPENLSQQYELINPMYQEILAQANIHMVENIQIPQANSLMASDAADWLKQQIPLVVATVRLEVNQLFSKQSFLKKMMKIFKKTKITEPNLWTVVTLAIFYRNLFIAFARQAVLDRNLIDYKYKNQPLWDKQKQHQIFEQIIEHMKHQQIDAQSVNLAIEQLIFNIDDMAREVDFFQS